MLVRELLSSAFAATLGTDVWGRPVGLLVLPDGSLLVSGGGGNKIWRTTSRK